jgi:hypothetical protein
VADLNLTQDEADALIGMEKIRLNDDEWTDCSMGGSVSIPLTSTDKRESFILDIYRGRIDLLKGTYQNRARQAVVLVRLDFGGRPHRNPNDQEIASPHLHVYREGYGSKWAVEVPADKFPRTDDMWQKLQDFMAFCNITETPLIRKGLFA